MITWPLDAGNLNVELELSSCLLHSHHHLPCTSAKLKWASFILLVLLTYSLDPKTTNITGQRLGTLRQWSWISLILIHYCHITTCVLLCPYVSTLAPAPLCLLLHTVIAWQIHQVCHKLYYSCYLTLTHHPCISLSLLCPTSYLCHVLHLCHVSLVFKGLVWSGLLTPQGSGLRPRSVQGGSETAQNQCRPVLISFLQS